MPSSDLDFKEGSDTSGPDNKPSGQAGNSLDGGSRDKTEMSKKGGPEGTDATVEPSQDTQGSKGTGSAKGVDFESVKAVDKPEKQGESVETTPERSRGSTETRTANAGVDFESVKAVEKTDLEKKREAEFQEMKERVAEADPSTRGKEFEAWTSKWVFDGKHRVTVPLITQDGKDNLHLDEASTDSIGLSKSRRTSDNYVSEEGDLWECKAYGENSQIDLDQLRDYNAMVQAGRVFDSSGSEVKVRSINYLFSDKAAAEANASLLKEYGAIGWYVDGTGTVMLLEGQEEK